MPNVVDARGKSCPLPIVLLAKATREIDHGETLIVQADDRAFPQDVEAWCRKTGNELVQLERAEAFFEAHIRKG
jgi:tRNA 2-thiouridine synthesizing protein A